MLTVTISSSYCSASPTHADDKKCHGVCFHPQASSSGKEAAVKNPGEASNIILDYLTSTNRPYGKCSVKS